MVTLLLLLGCASGPDEATVLDDVRVLAVQADPPEVGPGEASTFTATVVDPGGIAPDVLIWTCLDLGDGCLEAAGRADAWLTLATPQDEQVVTSRTAPAALAAVLSDEIPAVGVPVWALACPPGVCPLLEDARQALAEGVVSEDLAARLASPEEEMVGLDFEAASLARRSWAITSLEERNAAPVILDIVMRGSELEVVAEDADGDELLAWPYATQGAFDAPSVPVGAEPLVYYPPEGGGDARLYVVVDDGRGGQALARRTLTE